MVHYEFLDWHLLLTGRFFHVAGLFIPPHYHYQFHGNSSFLFLM